MTRTPIGPAEAGAPASRGRMVRLRLMLLALGASLWALVILVRLVHLQVLERPFFQKQSARQSERTITLEARRGAIFDRAGRPLAVSVDAESIYAVPQDVSDPARTAVALARAIGLDAVSRKEVLGQLQKNRAFVWVKRKVSPGAARAVRELSARRHRLPLREPPLLPQAGAGLPGPGLRGPRQPGHERHRVLLRGRAQGTQGDGGGDHRRPPASGGPHREALDGGALRRPRPRRERAAHGRARARPGHGRDPSVAGVVVVVAALHGRGPGHGQPADLQPEQLPELLARDAGRTAP